MKHSPALLGLAIAVAMIASACGGGSTETSSSSTTAAPTTAAPTTAAPTTATPTTAAPTTAAPTTAAPTTATPTTAAPTTAAPVRGVIQESFVGNVATEYTPGQRIVEGEVRVYFNNGTSGMIVAIYHGPGVADPTGLCPGNSIHNGTTWVNISNAPATEGACDGFPTDVGSVRVCTSGVMLYQTMIPNDAAGTLYGSLEANTENGLDGMTATATNQPGTPEIDYLADVFDISPMFTSDGSDEITCAAALT